MVVSTVSGVVGMALENRGAKTPTGRGRTDNRSRSSRFEASGASIM